MKRIVLWMLAAFGALLLAALTAPFWIDANRFRPMS